MTDPEWYFIYGFVGTFFGSASFHLFWYLIKRLSHPDVFTDESIIKISVDTSDALKKLDELEKKINSPVFVSWYESALTKQPKKRTKT